MRKLICKLESGFLIYQLPFLSCLSVIILIKVQSQSSVFLDYASRDIILIIKNKRCFTISMFTCIAKFNLYEIGVPADGNVC